MLATSWATPDYQTFTFNLRNDVYFHNGDHFTAEDVAGTIRVARENPGSIGHDRWRAVESWNIPDPYTIELVLSEIHVDFFFDISAPPAGIINEAAFRADPEEGVWVGTGPFQAVDFSTNDFFTVERFDRYWGDIPPTQSLTLRFVPEIATRLVMLQNRESHLCFGIGVEDLAVLDADPDFRIIPVVGNHPNGLAFNMEDPLMADPNFRRAVFHAINLEEIAIVAAGDWARAPDDGNVWGFDTPFRINDIPRWEHNLELARQYLEASPYAGETVEISAGVVTNIRAAELVQHQLGQIGIDVVVNAMDLAGWVASVAWGNNQSQMHINGITFTLSPIASVTNVFMPGMGTNRTSFNDPYVTDLIERARVSPDANERRELLEHLQRYIAADPPFVNLFWRVFGIGAVNELGGVELNSDTFRHNLRGLYLVLE